MKTEKTIAIPANLLSNGGDTERFINVITKCREIGYDDYEIGYNSNSGYVYAWSEDYNFCIGEAFNGIEAIFKTGDEQIENIEHCNSIEEIENLFTTEEIEENE